MNLIEPSMKICITCKHYKEVDFDYVNKNMDEHRCITEYFCDKIKLKRNSFIGFIISIRYKSGWFFESIFEEELKQCPYYLEHIVSKDEQQTTTRK